MAFFQVAPLTKNRISVTAPPSRLYPSLAQAAVHHVMLGARRLTPAPLSVSGFSSFYRKKKEKKKASFHSTRPAPSLYFMYRRENDKPGYNNDLLHVLIT